MNFVATGDRAFSMSIASRAARFRFLVRSDLWRYEGRFSMRDFVANYVRNPGFRYCFYHRLWNAVDGAALSRLGIQQFLSWRLRRMGIRFGLSIPPRTALGAGFYIGHFGGVVIHPDVRFGRDCNLSQGVTVGLASRGEFFGCPTFGDRVYIGPGAKVFGKIQIGNDVAIGANAVVTRSVAANSVVVGAPARAISSKGSAGYVINTNYGEP